MQNILARFAQLSMLGLLMATGGMLAGCQDGAFEAAGEEIDDAADEVGDAFN